MVVLLQHHGTVQETYKSDPNAFSFSVTNKSNQPCRIKNTFQIKIPFIVIRNMVQHLVMIFAFLLMQIHRIQVIQVLVHFTNINIILNSFSRVHINFYLVKLKFTKFIKIFNFHLNLFLIYFA